MSATALAVFLAGGAAFAQDAVPTDGSVLPFPPTPLESTAGPTLADSTLVRAQPVSHLPADAPNILIILMDDVGFGVPDTFGGFAHTPTLTALAEGGIAYNTFHTASICSTDAGGAADIAEPPQCRVRHDCRTGGGLGRLYRHHPQDRRHDRRGLAPIRLCHCRLWQMAQHPLCRNDGDGTVRPLADRLRVRDVLWFPCRRSLAMGAAFGPQHHDHRPARARELPPDRRPCRSGDFWLRERQAYAPDKPFFMYWAPGASHGPHHIFPEWADHYTDQFDDGWDALRERTFANQLAMGWIPEDTELTPRPDTLASWDSIPDDQRDFQTRLMEVFAGYTEHADAQAGRLVDEIDRLGLSDNTIIFYIYGDNGSSAEGQTGTVSELLAQNNLASDMSQHLAAVEERGGLAALGGPLFDNMYHAGWAWAGSTPFQSTKLVAAHFGGTRNPLVISWPDQIQHDGVVRDQFYHVIDIGPTIYDILDITPPEVVNGEVQDPIDGVSMLSSFADPAAPSTRTEQYFENNGSRAIYQDGWVAATFGPLVPWNTAGSNLTDWDPSADVWELYNITEDFSEAHDLAAENPEKLAELQAEFETVAAASQVYPVGASLWLRIHPEDRIVTPYTSWTFDESTRRMQSSPRRDWAGPTAPSIST